MWLQKRDTCSVLNRSVCSLFTSGIAETCFIFLQLSLLSSTVIGIKFLCPVVCVVKLSGKGLCVALYVTRQSGLEILCV